MSGISIITPFYCGEKYLPNLQRMVDGNVKKLRENKIDIFVQFIVVNDSPWVSINSKSSYGSFEYTVVNYANNKGIHGARVAGLAEAKGDYVLFLDQDDEVLDECLLEHYLNIGDGDVDVGNAWIEQPGGERKLLYRKKFQYQKITMLETYTKSHNQIVSPGQCLIRKLAIPEEWKQYETKKNGSDDLLLWVLMLSDGKQFRIYTRALYTHKYTGENLSQSESKMNHSSLEVADILESIGRVDEKIIISIRKSREFEIHWSKSNRLQRCQLILKNLDDLFLRFYWKVKSEI